MINQVKLKLPYPVRVGFFSLNLKKTVNFSFDNFALFLFREKQLINAGADLNTWMETHGKYDLFVHGCFHAAEAYCLHNRLKFDLDLKKFSLGLAQLPESDLKLLTDTWRKSQEFGAVEMPGKKKVKATKN